MKVKYVHPADQIVNAMTRIYKHNMTTISGGNISVRDENGDTWISPTLLDKGYLNRQEICVLRKNGDLEGLYKPSMEYRFHLGLLEHIPGCRAVIHAHCPDATAFCALNRYPDVNLWHDARKVFRPQEFGRVGYFPPGTVELKDAMDEQARSGKTVIFMDNHGITVAGKDISDAWTRVEMIEKLATIDLLTHRLAAVKPIEGELVSYAVPIEVRPALTDWTVGEADARKQLAHYAWRANEKEMISTVSGSLSAKVGENEFVITPEGADLSELDPADLVLVKDGAAYGGTPCEDWKIHEEILRRNPEYKACYFITPTYGMAFASNSAKMNLSIYMNTKPFADMRILPYASSMEDVVQSVRGCGVSLIRNRGYIVAAQDPQKAFDEAESLAEFAMVECRAGQQKWRELPL